MSGLPRLMILGGGSSQLRAISIARDLGFFVICADRDRACPGRTLADEFAEVSTFDREGVLRGARRHAVDAIYAIGSDQPILTAAWVSEQLGLPYPLSAAAASAVTNKRIMKKRLADAGIATARWRLLSDDPASWEREGLGELTPPWVAKPVDSQGQRGVARIETEGQLRRHLPTVRSFSREPVMLVEEYYPSTEVTVSGWVHAGDVEIWTITDRVTIQSESSLGVCSAHRFPSMHSPENDDEITAITRSVVAAFELDNAPIYFQMLLGARGVLVNEIASRLGGAYEDQSIPLVTGIDILRLSVGEVLSAVKAPYTHAGRLPVRGTPSARVFSVPLLFANPGVVTRYEGFEEMRARPGVVACTPLLPVGTEILPMQNSTQRIAYAVLAGSDRAAANRLVDTLFDTIQILDRDGTNMLLDTREDCRVR